MICYIIVYYIIKPNLPRASWPRSVCAPGSECEVCIYIYIYTYIHTYIHICSIYIYTYSVCVSLSLSIYIYIYRILIARYVPGRLGDWIRSSEHLQFKVQLRQFRKVRSLVMTRAPFWVGSGRETFGGRVLRTLPWKGQPIRYACCDMMRSVMDIFVLFGLLFLDVKIMFDACCFFV